MSTADYEQQTRELEAQLAKAETFEAKLDIKDRMLELKAQQGVLSTPDAWFVECLGCGS